MTPLSLPFITNFDKHRFKDAKAMLEAPDRPTETQKAGDRMVMPLIRSRSTE